VGTGVDNGAPPPYSPPPGQPWNPPAPPSAAPGTDPHAAAWPAEPPAAAPQPAPGDWPGTAYGTPEPAPAVHPLYGVPAPRGGGHGSRRDRRARGGPFGPVPRPAAPWLVLGAVLLAGAGIAALATGDGSPSAAQRFAAARDLWHDHGVDTLFPRTLTGPRSGPGGADRTWTRIGVAPDGTCAGAFDAPLAKALAPAGCVRLLRATYADATSTDVTTVGILVTSDDRAGQQKLHTALAGRTGSDPSAVPLPVAFPGTPAAHFGPDQRGSWSLQVSTRLPVVVYAVSGLADGRPLTPQAAAAAKKAGATSVPAQAGLGFEADGLAGAVGRALDTTAGEPHPEHSR
jgi:hypothetical protein